MYFNLRFLLSDETRPDVRGRSPGRLQRPRPRAAPRRFGENLVTEIHVFGKLFFNLFDKLSIRCLHSGSSITFIVHLILAFSGN